MGLVPIKLGIEVDLRTAPRERDALCDPALQKHALDLDQSAQRAILDNVDPGQTADHLAAALEENVDVPGIPTDGAIFEQFQSVAERPRRENRTRDTLAMDRAYHAMRTDLDPEKGIFQ